MRVFMIVIAVAASLIGFAPQADAQPYRHHNNGWNNGHHDNGQWRRHSRYRGHHYGWRHRTSAHRVCYWRHHHRVCTWRRW